MRVDVGFVVRVSCVALFSVLPTACTLNTADGSSLAAGDELARAGEPTVESLDSAFAVRAAPRDPKKPYRIVAGNLSSGNKQGYDPGHGTRLFQALAPDLALVQELNYGDNQATSVRRWIDEAFGSEFSYVRENNVHIPNAIVSRFPITESGAWRDPAVSDRSFVWARTTTPTGAKVFAVSVHLSTRSGFRPFESQELSSKLRGFARADEQIVVGGDFNAKSASDIGIRGLSPLVSNGGKIPVDEQGNSNTNSSRKEPYDQVLLSPALAKVQVPTVVGNIAFPNGLVFDTRNFSGLAAAPPSLRGDSGAPQMQHMAVVRDLAL
jgi:Endonuclease/Exonuclease/phosphatase family